MLRCCCVTAICLSVAACALPRDPEKTSERVASTHELRVGVTEVSRAGALACDVDPRLADVTIAPVKELPEDVARARQPEHA